MVTIEDFINVFDTLRDNDNKFKLHFNRSKFILNKNILSRVISLNTNGDFFIENTNILVGENFSTVFLAINNLNFGGSLAINKCKIFNY